MHNISLLQDDLRYYLSIAAPAELNTLQYGGNTSPPVGEVIRFGQSAGLCVTRTLALALKSEWQRSLADTLVPGTHATPLDDYIRIHPDEAMKKGSDFKPGRDSIPSIDELYAMFTESGLLATSPLGEREAFHELAGLIIERLLHLFPADSPELIEFACSREGTKAAMGEENSADAERYRIIHATWRELEDELATLLLRLETQTLKNERINQRWLETFGYLYIPLAESERLYSDLLALVEHVRSNPGLSAQELEELEKELLTIHTEAGRSRKREAPLPRGSESGGGGPGGMPWSAAEMEAYDEECKALLRRIWQFTHPDRIGREGFTEAQRRRLVDCYQEAMAWKEKARFEDDEIFLARRSTSTLRMILDRVERIWEEMGLDMESTASVRGRTMEERLAWLEARILILDEEIKEVKAEILAVAGDPDSREKMACMVSPERIAAVLDHMEERLAWYHEQIELHEEELTRLLSARKCGGADA